MKILILNSPLFKNILEQENDDILPPLGLGYILSHLKDMDIDVDFFDAVYNNIPFEKLLKYFESINPQFIGTNIFSTNYFIVKELVEKFKGKTKFIIGGLATSSLYEKILSWQSNNDIDVVIGDGELITPDIILNKMKVKPKIHIKNRRVFLIDKNSLYYNTNISNDKLDRSFFLNEPVVNHYGQKEISIVTSRGCIYDCAFCGAAKSQNKETVIRYRSNESIINELTQIHENFPEVESIRILDDLFLKSKSSIRQAVQIFEKFNYSYRSMAHVRTFLSQEQSLLNDLRRTGCKELFIGLESGSEKILKMINKNFDVKDVYNSLIKIFGSNIDVKGYFILGFPGENIDDIELTYCLAKNLKQMSAEYHTNFRISVFQYRPYHGTKLYYDLLKKYPESELECTEPNEALTKRIGRRQFNFFSKNFSDVSQEIIHDYICRTIALNDPEKFTAGK